VLNEQSLVFSNCD